MATEDDIANEIKEAIDAITNKHRNDNKASAEKIEYGLNYLAKSDLEEIKARNHSFTDFVSDFVTTSKTRANQQLRFRNIFFYITMLIFVALVVICVCTVKTIVSKPTTGVGDVAAIIGSFSAVMSALIVLPKTIAEHLFPSVEQDKSIALFSKALEEDRQGRVLHSSSSSAPISKND